MSETSLSPGWVHVLRDGTKVRLRLACREDFPLWCRMIEACTPETIWKRFEVHSKEVFLKRAEGFFSCGGEGELVVVAELVERPGTLVGEARMCLIPGGEVAEFCVLVADPWQGKGLGSLLTELALRMGKERGVKRVLVEVVPENVTIINFLRKRGFRFRRDPDGLIFLGEKILD